MKTLKTLVKLQKKQLDDLLLQIAAKVAKKDAIEEKMKSMQDEAEEEKQRYQGSTEYAFMLSQYLDYTTKQEKLYTKEMTELDREIDVMRDDLFNQFGELKKLEITLERRIQAEKLAASKAEDKALDEMTVLRYKGEW